jgi:ribosomal protein S27AE
MYVGFETVTINMTVEPFDASVLCKDEIEPKTIKAPFTEDQVASLNAYQKSEFVHPFTCVCGDHIPLVATKDGWICNKCAYTQKWAHDFMADWAWKVMEVKV